LLSLLILIHFIVMSSTTLFGNFHNYYAFNAVSERLRCITDGSNCLQDMAVSHTQANNKPFTVLDLGCNEGDVSLAMFDIMASHLATASPAHPCELRIAGVDFDAVCFQTQRAIGASMIVTTSM
jgi:hypothetical protein